MAQLNRYVGYYEPYATSHEDLDRDRKFQDEVRNAAKALVAQVKNIRSGKYRPPEKNIGEPRAK
jgi:hypothetical protein